MAKSTRALGGAAKDAYLKRAVRAEADIPDEARNRLTLRLQGEIASLSLRSVEAAATPAEATEPSSIQASEPMSAAGTCVSAETTEAPVASPCAAAATFDPYSPNVIVVIRTRGREAVLAQLAAIVEVEHLRLLAREQQLGIASDLADANEMRLAIVVAAERRIANRRAAAS